MEFALVKAIAEAERESTPSLTECQMHENSAPVGGSRMNRETRLARAERHDDDPESGARNEVAEARRISREPAMGDYMLDAPRTKRLPFSATMKRAISTAILLGTGFLLVSASPGCSEQGVGDPCTPEQEYDPSFGGFDAREVNVESKSFQCRTRICLVNHFQGRVSCPYGQLADGQKPAAAKSACLNPGDSTKAVTGLTNSADPASFRDPEKKALVKAQCVDRTADKAVYCSCRCADANGEKPSGQTFCDCPDGFSCSPLVTSIGAGSNEGLTGSYCIKSKTEYDKNSSCKTPFCDPVTNKCD